MPESTNGRRLDGQITHDELVPTPAEPNAANTSGRPPHQTSQGYKSRISDPIREPRVIAGGLCRWITAKPQRLQSAVLDIFLDFITALYHYSNHQVTLRVATKGVLYQVVRQPTDNLSGSERCR